MVIACINQKGGCGKSSTCFHLGGHLAERGHRVLLIDADPQGSLGQAFFGSQFVESLPSANTLANAFVGMPEATAVNPTAFDGVAVVCANFTLAEHNVPQPDKTGMQQWAIRELLASLPAYDFVLIDCPPNLYQCSWNALLAARTVLVPVPPEDFGVQGLRAVQHAVDQASRMNPELRAVRYLITRASRRLVVHQMYEQQLRELYADEVLDTLIPEAVAFKAALTSRTPVTISDPRSIAAESIRRLADELVSPTPLLSQDEGACV